MPRSASLVCACVFTGVLGAGVLGWTAVASAQGTGEGASRVPDFSGLWQRDDPLMQFMPPPEGYQPLLREHPEHVRNPQGDELPFIADPSDPLLQPWVSANIADKNHRQLDLGETILPAHSLCWPSGVPAALRLREPVRFLQHGDRVTIVYQRDHQIRRIYLGEEHPENIEPSWYGHSIGHFDSDNLVVDTVGLNNKTTVDWWGTPHTEQIHVVEKYRIMEGGRMMEVLFTVEDPGAFTRPWSAVVHYRRLGANAQFNEVVCAENNKDASTGRDFPIPLAAKADF